MKFLDTILSFIFPPVCGICNKISDTYLCENCFNKLKEDKIYMPQITYDSINKEIEHCYLFEYKGIIREKILQYKFYNKPYLSNMFFEFFAKNEKVCGFLKKYDIIIPVAMTKKKVAQRGYNQSELIASKIAKHMKNLKLENTVLIKCKETKVQSTLNKKQRLENVKNVYKIENKQKIMGKEVLIFDDIYTTGATCKECVKILKLSGVKSVGILTIAKDFQKIN